MNLAIKEKLSIKDFVPKNKLNLKIENDLKGTDKSKKKLIGIKFSTKDAETHIVLHDIKQYVLLETILKVVT